MTEYHNEATQAQRREVLKNDRRQAGTFFEQAQAEVGALGGRYKHLSSAKVTGVPQYPRLPASSPWAAGDPVPLEPPLGIDVNHMEPLGRPVTSTGEPTPGLAVTAARRPFKEKESVK